jgi:heme-degrading monooxygenase HmoA
MIVEVRSYRITPGKRDEFVEIFKRRSISALQGHGMKIVGPLIDLENPHKFIFLRGFPSMEDLHRMKDEFYGGKLWKEELEQILMPMIESYDVVLCETAPGFVMDDLREDSK